jgi:hypothetical protein
MSQLVYERAHVARAQKTVSIDVVAATTTTKAKISGVLIVSNADWGLQMFVLSLEETGLIARILNMREEKLCNH